MLTLVFGSCLCLIVLRIFVAAAPDFGIFPHQLSSERHTRVQEGVLGIRPFTFDQGPRQSKPQEAGRLWPLERG